MKRPEDRAARDRDLFDRIADRYADKDVRPAMRVARRQRALATWGVLTPPKARHLLEVGCGAGFASDYLAGCYDSYLGIDYSEQLIVAARDLNSEGGRDFQTADAMTFVPETPPDVVLMIGVLHHVDRQLDLLRRIFDFMSPGGWLLANEPQSSNRLFQLTRRLRSRVDGSYSAEQDQYDPPALKRLANEAGFENTSVHGQGLFSTPIAEARLPGQPLLYPVAKFAKAVDAFLERRFPALVSRVGWNVVLAAQKGTHGQARSETSDAE